MRYDTGITPFFVFMEHLKKVKDVTWPEVFDTWRDIEEGL